MTHAIAAPTGSFADGAALPYERCLSPRALNENVVSAAALPARFDPNPAPVRRKVSGLAHVGLGALALCSILFGFYQGPLGAWLLAR